MITNTQYKLWDVLFLRSMNQVHTGTISEDLKKDWLQAWSKWAMTKKQGKLSQFIVKKLEENVRKWLREGG